jgi:hypothetical protein
MAVILLVRSFKSSVGLQAKAFGTPLWAANWCIGLVSLISCYSIFSPLLCIFFYKTLNHIFSHNVYFVRMLQMYTFCWAEHISHSCVVRDD